ncbi:PEP-CTERM sorting domain-containing protein [Pseudanabaena sp. FACHB-1998]|uniref:PEP-CTERM sorting domain-containing protein n=1 Tax=Pseudanabaena sp. FACHB-1998 TaxID=2692858 RepID=UPI00168189BF|nr:PEP-CTERM sorting domain-containing protein [Pseudanabaena sp. FACHB-1998]MBD2176109.1 PEP-CTERM sorting domain-containing protein [Pseudanabaena sp. FACHB-1998]
MNNVQKLFVSAVGLAALSVGTAKPADAAYLTYFGQDQGQGESVRLAATPQSNQARNNFFSNLVGVGTETFESKAIGATAPIVAAFGADFATITGSGSIEAVTPGTTNGVGRYAISGSKFYEVSGNFTLTFNTAQAAFGFYGVDIGDFNGQVTLTFNKVTGGTQTFTVPTTQTLGGGSLYFGVIGTDTNDLFSSVTFGNTSSGVDFFAFDDFSIGRKEQVRAVPVPGVAAGIVLAAGIFSGKQLRKRKNQASKA